MLASQIQQMHRPLQRGKAKLIEQLQIFQSQTETHTISLLQLDMIDWPPKIDKNTHNIPVTVRHDQLATLNRQEHTQYPCYS